MKNETLDEMYGAIQNGVKAIEDYRFHSCFVGAEYYAEACLKQIEKTADTLKECVDRLRGGEK